MPSTLPIPPADLRFNVAGERDEQHFDLSGKRSVEELSNALRSIDRSITDFERILEWGCGCGRMLRHIPFDASRQELHGCDIDKKAVDWIAQNLPEVRAVQNGEYPPLPYSDGYFDLIINHSVLSHLDEMHQDAWLGELRRVLSPDGILILTVLGAHAYAHWAATLPSDRPDLDKVVEDSAAALQETGIYFFVDDGWAHNFPKYYQSTFHAPWYIFSHWGEYFEVACYLTKGALGYQDMIVLRHKSPPPSERKASTGSSLQDEVAALRRQITDLRNSTSWRLTSPLRNLAQFVRPVRSK